MKKKKNPKVGDIVKTIGFHEDDSDSVFGLVAEVFEDGFAFVAFSSETGVRAHFYFAERGVEWEIPKFKSEISFL